MSADRLSDKITDNCPCDTLLPTEARTRCPPTDCPTRSQHMRSSPTRRFRDMRVARHREALKSCCWLRLYIYIYIHIHISTGNLWLLRHHCFSMFSSVMAPLMFGSCSPPVFHDLTSECSPGSTATGQIGQHQKLTRMQRTGDGQNVYI